MDSEEADEENQNQDGKTLLSIFKRGCVRPNVPHVRGVRRNTPIKLKQCASSSSAPAPVSVDHETRTH